MLEIPYEQHVDLEGDDEAPRTIEDLISARQKFIKTVERPEDLMVHLSLISQKIIEKRINDDDEDEEFSAEPESQRVLLEPTPEEIKLQAALMTKFYLTLLNWLT